MASKPKSKYPATQRSLPIAEIRNSTVVMRDGTLRGVLMVSSINFALKSTGEQEAIISAYMGFLNSLNYPLQIVVQSRKTDITPYLQNLEKIEKEQSNELLRNQISDYRQYVGELISLGDIMTKRFYVVVPYDPLSDKQRSFWSRLQELFTPASLVKLSAKKFEQRMKELEQRVGQTANGLGSVGLSATRLDTQGLIELYYNSYNPDTSEQEPLAAVGKIQLSG
ncbi:MAG: hypothetical protein AAB817_02055 [Patescibacteria group bacterium]